MAQNPYLPMNYPYANYMGPMYGQNFNPTYAQNNTQPVFQQNQTAQPQMSLPTIHAEIIEVEDEKQVREHNGPVGCTQMFMTKDERFIFIKTTFPNAPYQLVKFERQKEVEQETTASSVIDTSAFVTHDELDAKINELMNKRYNKYNKNKENFNKPTQSQEEVT